MVGVPRAVRLVLLVIFDPCAQIAPWWLSAMEKCHQKRSEKICKSEKSMIINDSGFRWFQVAVFECDSFCDSTSLCCDSEVPGRAGSWSNSLVQLTPQGNDSAKACLQGSAPYLGRANCPSCMGQPDQSSADKGHLGKCWQHFFRQHQM